MTINTGVFELWGGEYMKKFIWVLFVVLLNTWGVFNSGSDVNFNEINLVKITIN